MKKIIAIAIILLTLAGENIAHGAIPVAQEPNYLLKIGNALVGKLATMDLGTSLRPFGALYAGALTISGITLSGALNAGDQNINNVGTMYVDADNNSGIGSNGDNDISFYVNGLRYLGFSGNNLQFLGGSPTLSTVSNTNLNLVPNGSGQTKVGDAGTCLSLATDNDDLCATDDVEVMDTLYTGGITMATNRGDVPWVDWSVTSSSADGTAQSLPFLIDGQFMMSLYSESDGAGSIDTKEVRTVSIRNYGDLITERMTLPNDTTLPATCAVGEVFADTDSDDCADTGGGDGAMCICKSTNTWALLVNY